MDIQNIISDVLLWQKTVEALNQERDDLMLNNKSLRSQIEVLSSLDDSNKKEIEIMKQSLKTLQESFLNMYDYRKECERLRLEMKKVNESIYSEKKQQNNKIATLVSKIEGLNRNHEDEIKKLNENKNVTIINLECKLNQEVMQWQQKAEEVRRVHEESILEKNREMVKLKNDFEGKIRRLQEQHFKIQNKASSGTTSNNVFRKKLQHERETSIKQITELEAEVNELRNKLTVKKDVSFISGYSRHIASTAKQSGSGHTLKKRKL